MRLTSSYPRNLENYNFVRLETIIMLSTSYCILLYHLHVFTSDLFFSVSLDFASLPVVRHYNKQIELLSEFSIHSFNGAIYLTYKKYGVPY